MDVILYFQPATKSSAPEKLAGVMEIAEKSRLYVQIIEERPTVRRIRELIDFWHPLGAIAECGGEYNDLDTTVFTGLPTVFLTHNPKTLGEKSFAVLHDSGETARLAARELLLLGYDHFAYIPFPENRFWSEERGTGFSTAIEVNGRSCRTFDSSAKGTRRQRALIDFLRSLPKPCAILAANDKIASEVLAAANLAKLAVPNDLSVLGVDNFEQICDHTTPALSSIEPDFRRGGCLAMLMLLAVIRSGKNFRGARIRHFGPLRIVRRASTRLLKHGDPAVQQALELIRRKACLGLTAGQVAKTLPCSRRMADIRFAQAVGHTILEEIHAVQLERAKQLLLDPNQQLKSISDFCGFTHPNSLRKFFLRETGLTLTAWRQKHLGHHSAFTISGTVGRNPSSRIARSSSSARSSSYHQ